MKPALTASAGALALPGWLTAELRTDHAGETGAVCIYRGVLAVSRDAGVRAFAARHLATEQSHLTLIDAVLPGQARSRLLPLWRLAGWVTGALPACFGPRAVYATIAAVETFVDRHYQQQIDRLAGDASLSTVHELLDRCRRDEVAHRDEAAGHAPRPGGLLRAWCTLVGWGSQAAVGVCRHV